MLRGKCRKCGEKIPLRYTLTEVANMLLWIISAFLFFEKSIPLMVIAALASSIMLCVFFIDIEHKLVFDRFVIMLSVLGITAMFFDPYYGWMSHLIGGIVGFVSFYSIAAIFAKLKNKECLGGGDIKLTAACGLLLGWQRLLLSVLIATVSASIVLVILSKKAEDEEKEYPFALWQIALQKIFDGTIEFSKVDSRCKTYQIVSRQVGLLMFCRINLLYVIFVSNRFYQF